MPEVNRLEPRSGPTYMWDGKDLGSSLFAILQKYWYISIPNEINISHGATHMTSSMFGRTGMVWARQTNRWACTRDRWHVMWGPYSVPRLDDRRLSSTVSNICTEKDTTHKLYQMVYFHLHLFAYCVSQKPVQTNF